VIPDRRLIYHLAAWLLVGIAAAVWEPLQRVWGAYACALGFLLVLDAYSLRSGAAIRVTRQVPATLSLGVWARVGLRVANPASVPVRLELFDHYPTSAELEGLPLDLAIPAGGWAELQYRIRPRRRGDFAFAPAELLIRSRHGLWRRRLRCGEPRSVRVLPNVKAVAGYALLAVEDRLGQMGIRVHQRRGSGMEFQELREYRQGDLQRQIDWKATARRRKLISREYQDEKNQQIVLLLDCGRRMRALDGDIAHFDHALNAVLLLSWVALGQGDAVGVMTMGGEKCWRPPLKGATAMSTILGSIYDVETSPHPPDYLEAATRLMSLQKRRSLIVVMTNLRDEDSTELVPALELLRRRHLVLLASLREAVLNEVLERPLLSFPDALLVSATHHYLVARDKAHDQIRGRGILTLDVEPQRLPIEVVNRYLDVKRSGLL